MFEFKDLDVLVGEEIDLRISEKVPADQEKGYVPAYKYDMMLHNTDTKVGFIDIRIGFNENIYYGGNIGYNVSLEYRGHHYAMMACQIIKQVALVHDMKELYITCDPSNIPSRRTCERLNLKLLEIANLPEHNPLYLEGLRQVCIFYWDLIK